MRLIPTKTRIKALLVAALLFLMAYSPAIVDAGYGGWGDIFDGIV
jgi:hypothetical protein